MSRKSRETILKRVREQKRREKAQLKRERRLARKQGKDAPDDDQLEELDAAENGPEDDTVDDPVEEVVGGPAVGERAQKP